MTRRGRTDRPAAPQAPPVECGGGPLYLTALFLAAVCIGGAPLLPSARAEPNGVMALALLGLLCGLAWLAHWVLVQRRAGRPPFVWRTAVGWPLALFLLLMALSTVTSRHVRPGIVSLLEWGGAAALFLVLTQLLRGRKAQRFVPSLLAASLLVIALHGLHQKFVDLPAARAMYRQNPDEVMQRLGLPVNLKSDLAGRMGAGTADRVFGTFLQPTTLAGFIALVLPVAVAWLTGAWRRVRGARRGALAAVGGGYLAAVFWCFAEARSKGGLLALMAAAGVVTLWMGWRLVARSNAKRKRLVFAGAVLALVVLCAGVLAGGIASGKLPPWRDFVGSFVVRAGYWRAGVLMAADHPVFGIGPDNFQDAYMTYKRAEDQDARRAHNDYVQIAAEMGFIALAAYLWLWIAFLRRMLTGTPRAAEEPEPVPNRYVVYAGLLAGVIIFVLELRFGETFASSEGAGYFLWPAILWVCWSAAFVFVYALADAVPARALRIGVVAASAALLVHTVVDFNMQVAGYRTTALVIVALGVGLMAGKPRRPSWSPAVLVGALAVCAAVQLTAWGFFARPAGRAQELYERATWIRGGVIEGTVAEQIALMKRAAALDPLNADYPGALCDLHNTLIPRARTPVERRRQARQSLAYAKEAARINPLRALNSTRIGRAHVLLSGFSESRSAAEDELEQALQAYRRAKELYPSSPVTTADLGEVYELLGRRDKAAAAYREALDLNRRQYSHMQGVLPVDRKRRIVQRLKAWGAR